MAPKKNSRKTKERTRSKESLNRHNADTARFWKESNHRRARRKLTKGYKNLVEALDRGIVQWQHGDDNTQGDSRPVVRPSYDHWTHKFNLADSWPTSGDSREGD